MFSELQLEAAKFAFSHEVGSWLLCHWLVAILRLTPLSDTEFALKFVHHSACCRLQIKFLHSESAVSGTLFDCTR
jgi:hypothetical protein